MMQKELLIAVVICALVLPAFNDALAVDPPAPGLLMPRHVVEAQKEISESYSESGIARRLQQIKYEKDQASKSGEAYSAIPTSWDMPVIMGSYSDNANLFTASEFYTNLFGANPTGSMSDYYYEVSYGQFTLTGTVYGPFTAAQTQAYYVNGDNGFGSDFPTNVSGFIYSILGSADASVDFSQYDNDGPDGIPNSGDDDGFVDVLTVIFPDGSASEGDSDNFWAHKWNLQYGAGAPYSTNDARTGGGFIQIDLYTVQGAELGDGTWNTIGSIGVFCHEFGHALDLPDLYDTDGDSYGIGTYGLMGAGGWGAAYSYATKNRPTHLCAWSKVQLGWVTPTVVVGTQTVQLPPVETSPVVYKLWDDTYQGGRCFLLENRTQTGFDAGLYGEGILVWHCNNDVWYDNSVNDFRVVDLEEADGLNEIDTRTRFMDARDFYPGTTNNTTFNDASNPNAWDVFGVPTGVSAANFSYGPGSDITVTLTQRGILGYTIAYDSYYQMRGWGTSSPSIRYGAVRFTVPEGGTLVAVQAGVQEDSPIEYTVKIYNDMSGSTPVGLQSTTSGSFPTVASDRYHEIELSSPLALTPMQTFLVDVAFGPGSWAVPFTYMLPISGNSYYSQNGSSYSNWTDKDILIRARILTAVDSDGDGILDPLDNCPNDPNAGQGDSDYDGVGNICDNCPYIFNSAQTDNDSDDVGDACDVCEGHDDADDTDGDTVPDGCDICAGHDDSADSDEDTVPDGCDNCPDDPNPGQEDSDGDNIGDVCDGCCIGRVGDANGQGGDEPTIGDVSTMIDALFIGGDPVVIACLTEADVNQTGGVDPEASDITIGDISTLIDYLFITGPELGLPECL